MDSLELKGLTLRNRIVLPPMQTGFASAGGAVTTSLIEHYVKRSRALGLPIVEHSYVSLDGKLSQNQLGIHDDKLIAGLEKLSSSIHATGTPTVIQINHAGKNANREITGFPPVGPSASSENKELLHEDIEALINAFGLAARRAMKAGFDGVEVHGAHGFLVNQFYSPLSNKRKDQYGGSLENRMRFPLEVVRRVKNEVGGRLLLYRLGSDDLDVKGTQIEDSKRFAVRLEEAGVNIIDVSGGQCGSRPAQFQDKQGYFISQAQRIKEKVGIPVIGVGGITDPTFADMLIRTQKVDLVAVGRALLEDFDWAVEAVRTLKEQVESERQ